MAQEATKLAKKLKEEEEASQLSGIPIKKLLNNSFTEQLNYIQVLQQTAPLHSAREHLPQDIIRILERLDKVETTPFDKLYYLVENCTDRYYTKVIQTFVKIIKQNIMFRFYLCGHNSLVLAFSVNHSFINKEVVFVI